MTDTELISLLDKNSIKYQKLGKRTTVCFAVTKQDFELVGTSFCMDYKQFDERLGEQYALQDVLRQLEKMEGYIQNQANYYSKGVRNNE